MNLIPSKASTIAEQNRIIQKDPTEPFHHEPGGRESLGTGYDFIDVTLAGDDDRFRPNIIP